MGTAARTRKKKTPWLLWHSWLGLPIWAFLFFVCVTGTFATVAYEVMWLVDPEVRATGGGSDAPPSAFVAAAEAAADGKVTALQRAEPYMAMRAYMATADGRSLSVWMDPATAEVQGISEGPDLRAFMRSLHGWLLTYPYGFYAVAALGIPMIGTLITGIMAYKRFWRSYTRPVLRTRNGPRVLWGDLHRLVGAWSLWFVAVIAVTGTWFLIRLLLWQFAGGLGLSPLPTLVARDGVPVVAENAPPPPRRLDDALAAARQAVPGGVPVYTALPGTAYDPVTVYLSGRIPLLTDIVKVNPFTADLMKATRGGKAPPLTVTSQVMSRLHFGDFGGLITKLIWFIFGVLLSGMIFSGMWIWTKRTALNARRIEQQARGQDDEARLAEEPSLG
jgi:uncharacterized iron-regulated membrane protein